MQAQQMLAEYALDTFFERLKGSFAVIYESGLTRHYGTGEPQFTIQVKDENILDLMNGDLLMDFGEAYMDGKIDVEGDLADVMSLAIRSGLMTATQTTPSFTESLFGAARKMRSPKLAKENIAHHYDLGNDFFGLWLDESMSYSCAYFHDPADTLEQAQMQKIDHSLAKLRLVSGETLLDIGCGWGAMAMRAAEKHGVQVTGITLSEEQYAGANETIKSRGLAEKVTVQLMDYETLASLLGSLNEEFDKIVSLGMIEHVGKDHLAKYVENVETMLKPGGLALLHLVTSVKEGPVNRWIEEYIFPGGYNPTLSEMISHLSDGDFRVWDVENLTAHYSLTIDQWSNRFEYAVPQVLENFSERFVRMWRLYLRVSSAAFRESSMEVHQILVSRGKPQSLPPIRKNI